jgi:hypothetical protein
LHFFNGIPLDKTRDNGTRLFFAKINLFDIKSVSAIVLFAVLDETNTDVETRNNGLVRLNRGGLRIR